MGMELDQRAAQFNSSNASEWFVAKDSLFDEGESAPTFPDEGSNGSRGFTVIRLGGRRDGSGVAAGVHGRSPYEGVAEGTDIVFRQVNVDGKIYLRRITKADRAVATFNFEYRLEESTNSHLNLLVFQNRQYHVLSRDTGFMSVLSAGASREAKSAKN